MPIEQDDGFLMLVNGTSFLRAGALFFNSLHFPALVSHSIVHEVDRFRRAEFLMVRSEGQRYVAQAVAVFLIMKEQNIVSLSNIMMIKATRVGSFVDAIMNIEMLLMV
ncbi:unnamed protein product [Victoria cruziana]